MVDNLTKEFVSYLLEKGEQIPDKVYEKAKECLFDYMAVTEAGALNNVKKWSLLLDGVETGTSDLIGLDIRTDAKTAALINGFNAHSLELDDGHRFAMIHLGGSIISALLSAQSIYGFSKEEVTKGIIIGYEAACRTAISIQPMHKKKGLHTAGTCGTIGSAVAVAVAMKQNRDEMMRTLTAAIGSATGLLEMQEQMSEMKPYNIGRAAMDGLMAAQFGRTSFLTPVNILDGDRGFSKLFSDGCNKEKLLSNEDFFEIERIYVKPYAACRHCHSAIEATMILREKVDANKIKKIIVETYELAIKGHNHVSVENESSAKLSIPYSVAIALKEGIGGISAYKAPHINDSDVIALTEKVEVIENQIFSKESPQKRIAKVIIETNDNVFFECQVDYPKGDPENSMTREEIKQKAIGLIGKENAEKLYKKTFEGE